MSVSESHQITQQIQQYLIQLEQIQKQLSISQIHFQQPHIQLLNAKINAKIKHFQTAAHQIRYNSHSQAGIKQLGSHLADTFAQIVKEAHRLLQFKVSEGGKQKLKDKLELLNKLQSELDEEWSGTKISNPNKLLRKIDQNTSILAQHVDQTQLRTLAKQYLHKEFLAIRMVAYRMYQRYTQHNHPEVFQQMEQLRQQHEQLRELAQEMGEANKELRGEEKRLIRELNQLKKVNEMVAKRYFFSSNDNKEL